MKKSNGKNVNKEQRLDVNLTISSVTQIYDSVKNQLDNVYAALQLLSTKREFLDLTDPMEILEQCKRIKSAQANFCEAQVYLFEVLQRFIARQDVETKLSLIAEQVPGGGNAMINDMIQNASNHVSENLGKIIDPDESPEGSK